MCAAILMWQCPIYLQEVGHRKNWSACVVYFCEYISLHVARPIKETGTMDRKDKKKGEKRLAEGWSSLPTYHLLFPHSIKISWGMGVKMRLIRFFFSCLFNLSQFSIASAFCLAMVLLFFIIIIIIITSFARNWHIQILSEKVAAGGKILHYNTWQCNITSCIMFSPISMNVASPWPKSGAALL